MKVLGTSKEFISLKNRMYDRKPSPAETVFDVKNTPRVKMRTIKKDVTNRTKRRRKRRAEKMLQKKELIKRLKM